MKIILRISGLLILSVFPAVVLAQESERIQMVEYTPGYKFRDGLYLNIEMVKANHPVPFSRIVNDRDNYNQEFFAC